MSAATAIAPAQPRRVGRSVAAIGIGFVVTAAISLATDQVLHVLKVYPPWGQPMPDAGDNLLALSYRIVYAILGCWLTARLAPGRPMLHAMILGAIGFVLSAFGAVVAMQNDFGPSWFPILLALTALPCAGVGGNLVRQT